VKAVFDVLEQLKYAESTSEIPKILEKISHLIEFDYFLLGIAIPSSITSSEVIVYDNYPIEWRKQYDAEGYAKEDPIVQYSMNNYLPITWPQILESIDIDKKQLNIMKEAERCGLKTGFSVPIHGTFGEFGMISFALANSTADQMYKYADAIPLIQMIVPGIQDALKRLKSLETKVNKPKLTKREIECLTWATEGKSSWEISKILGCSERTAIFHLANATAKLGATNRYQAISKALLSGVINPSL